MLRAPLSLGCLLLLAPAMQALRQLPPLPSDFRLSAIAREMAGNARGEVLELRTARDGRAHPVRFRVAWTSTGSLAHGEVVTFRWEDDHPPVQLDSGADPTDRSDALCIFDANRRLLAVSYEHEPAGARLLAALGMARVMSRRFSEEELDWAWLASRREGVRLPAPLSAFGLEGFVALSGHRELALRFGTREQKLEVLGNLQGKAVLTPDDLENLELCEHAPGELGDLAVHTLLEHGLRVEPALFLSEENRLCARLALGDEAAQAGILARLERARPALLWDPKAKHSAAEVQEFQAIQRSERMPFLVELAAYGSPRAFPHLCAFVQKRVENSAFAWLRLGGSGKDLLALQGGTPAFGPSELTRAATMEALRLELERCRAAAESHPSLLAMELLSLDALIDRLRPRDPQGVLELVQPVLRACLERAEVPALNLRMTLLRAGDERVIVELERMSADEIGQHPPPELEDTPGDKVVAILVKLLVRSLAGFDEDCTEQAQQNVAYLASVLHGRPSADRALALRLFDGSQLPPRVSEDDVISIRWALGELPEPRQLAKLGRSPVAVACRLELASEATRYASELVEMHKDPRKYWWPLALLGDEESLPAFGRWLGEGGDRAGSFSALLALEKTGSSAGAELLYAAIPALDPGLASNCYTVLGELESPGRLSRLASFCAARARPDGEAWRAFLILLGRRP